MSLYSNILLKIVVIAITVLGIIFLPHPKRSAPVSALCRTCDIILLDVDNIRSDELSCTGYGRPTTPNLCTLLSGGAIFTHHISQSFWTLPSEMSLLTGVLPSTHQIDSVGKALPASLPTIAETLHANGYITWFDGTLGESGFTPENNGLRGYTKIKQENGIAPMTQIEERKKTIASLEQSNTPFFYHIFVTALHMPYLLTESEPSLDPTILKPAGFPATKSDFNVVMKDYIAVHYREVFSDKAISDHRDLFFYPLQRKNEIYDLFVNSPRRIDGNLKQGNALVMDNAYIDAVTRLGDEGRTYMRLLYDTKLAEIDRNIGETLASIPEQVRKKTIVLFTSSHGEEFNEHGGYEHMGGNYNELIHIPFILSVPGIKKQTIDSISRAIDTAPTLYDIVGIKKPFSVQGETLVPYLLQMPSGGPEYAISEFNLPRYGASIQNKDWKLIVTDPFGENSIMELYHLSDDPKEQHDGKEQHNEIKEQLYDELKKRLHEARAVSPWNIIPLKEYDKLDASTRKVLENTGYFN